MFGKVLGICIGLALASPLAAAAVDTGAGAKLTAADIVNRNVAARGGLQAWRAVQTMSFEGKMGVGGNQRATLAVPAPPQKPGTGKGETLQYSARPKEEVQVPFLMELKRSHKQRFELQFNGKTAVQVFDGTQGWKVRPFLNRNEVESFTAEEMKMASTQSDLDGYLIDYAAKGIRVEQVGMEKVEERDTYKLKLIPKNGRPIHVCVDAKTFLEAKLEGQPRRMDGVYHPVEVYFRDYRQVNGLQIPFVLETKVLPVARTAHGFGDTPVPVERITIEKAVVNPKLDDSRFARPQLLAAASVSALRAEK